MANPPIFTPANARFLNPIADPSHREEDMIWWNALKQFAEREQSSENIDFYLQTIGIENLFGDPSTRKGAEERLKGIINEFFEEDSPRPINISNAVRIEFNNAETIDEKATAVASIRDEIKSLIAQNTMSRFLSSDDYQITAATVDQQFGTQYLFDRVRS
jgi:hypothetical protein